MDVRWFKKGVQILTDNVKYVIVAGDGFSGLQIHQPGKRH